NPTTRRRRSKASRTETSSSTTKTIALDSGSVDFSGISKSKLKGRARTVVQCGPEPSTVTFDNRTTDREPHTHAAGFGAVESMEDSFGAHWIKADSRVLHRNSDLIPLVAFGPDDQISLPIFHRAHRFDAVQDQIHYDLLYLYSIAHDRREICGQFRPQCYLVSPRFALGQDHNLRNCLVDVEPFLCRASLLKEGAHA